MKVQDLSTNRLPTTNQKLRNCNYLACARAKVHEDAMQSSFVPICAI